MLYCVFQYKITIFLIVSMILSQVDRSIHSECGFACGFILNQVKIPNPFDLLLTFSSRVWFCLHFNFKVFPIDYIIFTGFILLVLVASLTGLANIGISCCCLRVCQINKSCSLSTVVVQDSIPQYCAPRLTYSMHVLNVCCCSIFIFHDEFRTSVFHVWLATMETSMYCAKFDKIECW